MSSSKKSKDKKKVVALTAREMYIISTALRRQYFSMTDNKREPKRPEWSDFVKDLYPLRTKFEELVDQSGYHETDVRPIRPTDFPSVMTIDEFSGNHVYDMVKGYDYEDCNHYAYGMFEDNALIGYCTVGYAAGVYPELEKDGVCGQNDLSLSDVYIWPTRQGNGYGTMMVQKAIELEHKYVPEAKTVFATVFDNKLIEFYKHAGFEFFNEINGTIFKELGED